MSIPLAAFLKASMPEGLDYPQAVQLFLHTFCCVGVVPPELAPLTSKEQMSNAYSELARGGWIRPGTGLTRPGVVISPTEPDHWTQLVRHFLLNQLPYERDEGERLEALLPNEAAVQMPNKPIRRVRGRTRLMGGVSGARHGSTSGRRLWSGRYGGAICPLP